MSPSVAKAKGRGRPPKKVAREDSTGEEIDEEMEDIEEVPVKNGKGRPLEEVESDEGEDDLPPAKSKKVKGRGRPPAKAKPATKEDGDNEDDEEEVEDDQPEEENGKDELPVKKGKGRGRPPAKKAKKEEIEEDENGEDEEEEEEEKPARKNTASRDKAAKVSYKDSDGEEAHVNEGSDSEFDVAEDEDSGDDFDPRASGKKKTPVKKSKAGRKKGKKGGKGRGRGRPPGPVAPKKKKEGSPIYYEFDLSDTSEDAVYESDNSDDSNYRPNAKNTRVKKKKERMVDPGSSEDDCNWKPGKPFPGSKATTNGQKKGRGRPRKDDDDTKAVGRPKKNKEKKEGEEGEVKKRGRPKKTTEKKEDEETEEKEEEEEEKTNEDATEEDGEEEEEEEDKE